MWHFLIQSEIQKNSYVEIHCKSGITLYFALMSFVIANIFNAILPVTSLFLNTPWFSFPFKITRFFTRFILWNKCPSTIFKARAQNSVPYATSKIKTYLLIIRIALQMNCISFCNNVWADTRNNTPVRSMYDLQNATLNQNYLEITHLLILLLHDYWISIFRATYMYVLWSWILGLKPVCVWHTLISPQTDQSSNQTNKDNSVWMFEIISVIQIFVKMSEISILWKRYY